MFSLPFVFFGDNFITVKIIYEGPPNLSKLSHMLMNKSRYILVTGYFKDFKMPKDPRLLDRKNSLVIRADNNHQVYKAL